MGTQWQFNPLAVPLSISTLMILGLIGVGLRRRQDVLAAPFLFFMGCLFIWMLASLLEVLTLDLAFSLLVADCSFLGITFFPVAWLWAVMVYSGAARRFRQVALWVVVIPLLTNIVIWTNPSHRLWRGEATRDLTSTWYPVTDYDYGFWFYFVHMPYSLLIACVALYLLLRSLYLKDKVYRWQIISIMVAFCLPVTVELLYRVGLSPIPDYNMSTLVFPVSGALLGWALLGFQLMDLTPIARDLVVESMDDLMIVLDTDGRVVDLNPMADRALLADGEPGIGRHITDVLPGQPADLETPLSQGQIREIEITQGDDTRLYEMHISLIINGPQHAGLLLLLRDITIRRQAQQALFQQERQVAILEERQRVARDLHDSVNQTLFAASTLADLLPMAIEKKPEKVDGYAHEIKQLIHGATAEMRLILLELYPDALTKTDITVVIQHLCDAFTGVTGTIIDYKVSGSVYPLDDEVQIAFYRVTQEALNNISKHTQATEVAVTLKRRADQLILTVQDNGDGFDQFAVPADHFGLQNMQTRAQKVGATLAVESEPQFGTTIQLIKELS